MSKFKFLTDRNSESYCLKIAGFMVDIFKIAEEEAIKRINDRWKNKEFIGDNNIIYHEEPEFWAKDIYYGHDSYWWLKEDENF